MINQLKSWFKDKPHSFQEDDPRLSAAILLFHVMMADGKIDKREEDELFFYLQNHFELSDDDTENLIALAKTHVSNGEVTIALKLITREYSKEQRIGVLKEMWHMVFIDDMEMETENSFLERAAEILKLSPEETLAIYLEEIITLS